MRQARRQLFPLALMALAAALITGCATQPSPRQVMLSSDWAFHDIVDVPFVRQYARVPRPEGVMIIDSRPYKPKYVNGHLPTAVNIPYTRFDKLKDRLPKDKNTLLIFYCGGYHCKLSHKSARKAERLGYRNVKVFAAGYPAWKKYAGHTNMAVAREIKKGDTEGSIDIATFTRFIEKDPDNIMLIDVRDGDEYAKGHFKGAVNIPVDFLEKKLKSLPTDKPIVFVCSTGARSGESYYMVQDLRPELKKVYYLEAEVTYNKDGSYKIKKTQ